jgi:hypothetical protein
VLAASARDVAFNRDGTSRPLLNTSHENKILVSRRMMNND